MASLIHFNLNDPNFVLPDRNTIPHDVQFFQNVRNLIPEICHKRGILAIGGMTALFPSRLDAELNDRALKVLAEDKKNEAACLMDGAWTGHPDQNEIAIAQFPYPNQLDKRAGVAMQPDMRPAPEGVGARTMAGTRTAVRTVIHYRFGYLSGKGASLINGYMEDLATDRIYRLMIAQRVLHRKKVDIFDDRQNPVDHTPDLITRLFDEELEGILGQLPEGASQEIVDRYRQARQISEDMIVNEQFDPI
jgi:malate synthase